MQKKDYRQPIPCYTRCPEPELPGNAPPFPARECLPYTRRSSKPLPLHLMCQRGRKQGDISYFLVAIIQLALFKETENGQFGIVLWNIEIVKCKKILFYS